MIAVVGRFAALVASLATTQATAAGAWTILDCPGPPGVNLNDTQPGQPAVCSYKNTHATDLAVEMNFQVAGAEKVLGSLSCSISVPGSHAAAEVCSYTAQSAPYDGAPCWFLLPPQATFRCERVGIFYWLSTQVAPLQAPILSKASQWQPLSCPTSGAPGSCSWANTGQDAWLMMSLSNPGFNDEFVDCTVDGVTVCSYHSKYGRVNASSCGFAVGAGQKMTCSTSQGAAIKSAVAAPLLKNILSRAISAPINISCPFTTPEANNCPCTHNGSATRDSLIALQFSSPDPGDNSVWCYSSLGEDLCSLSWDGNPNDKAACVFFLPAGEQMSCKIQFGTLFVEQAVEIPLASNIFAPKPFAATHPTTISSRSSSPHHMARLIGDGEGRGPITAMTDVPAAEVEAAWSSFKRDFQRSFPATQDGQLAEAQRRRNFAHSLRQIRCLQATAAATGAESALEDDPERARFGVTEFADWSTEEWLAHTSGLQLPADSSTDALTVATEADTQGQEDLVNISGVDWRKKGVVTPVKNQAQCGNCWAFSSTASVESAWAIAGHPLVSLSEEFLTDCNYPQSPGGCGGGFNYQAYEFIIKNGIDTEASYKYTAGNGKASNCSRHWPPTSPVRIKDYKKISSNEPAMQAFAITNGPIAVGLDAAGPAWKHYIGGVLRSCCNHAQEHAPTIVGWGTEVEGSHAGGKYWIVRNSWGPTWGEDGHIRLEMGSNQCGITAAPVAPCVCKGCKTTKCSAPPPFPPKPPPIPPPPPPPATVQTCPMGASTGSAADSRGTYNCPLKDPVCCSVQFGSVSKPSAKHYCCPGEFPVCCALAGSSNSWCCGGTEVCSNTTQGQCDPCGSGKSSSRLATPRQSGSEGQLQSPPATQHARAPQPAATGSALAPTASDKQQHYGGIGGRSNAKAADPVQCTSSGIADTSSYSCLLKFPICCDTQLGGGNYCCESEHPVCCGPATGGANWCCGADTTCGNITGSCTPCAAAKACSAVKTKQACVGPRCSWADGKCGAAAPPSPPAPKPGPPPPPPPPPKPPPPPPPAPPPKTKPDWKCPTGGAPSWRMDGKVASASCLFTNNSLGVKMPPVCGNNCDYLDSHGYMGYTFDKQHDSPQPGFDPDVWPCPAGFELGSNSNNNNTGGWFCTLGNSSKCPFPSATSGLKAHCKDCPSDIGCVATGSFSYSWTLP